MTFNASWKRRLRRQTVKGIRAGAQALREADLPESRGIPCYCSMTFNASWKRRLRRQTVKGIRAGEQPITRQGRFKNGPFGGQTSVVTHDRARKFFHSKAFEGQGDLL